MIDHFFQIVQVDEQRSLMHAVIATDFLKDADLWWSFPVTLRLDMIKIVS